MAITKMNSLVAEQLQVTIGNKIICSNLNFALFPSQVIGILGANGSGKTTLLHTLANLHRPTQGQVLLNNVPLSDIPLKTIAQQLGVLFQDNFLVWAQTLQHYCQSSRYPHLPYHKKAGTEDRKIVQQALSIVGLNEDRNQLVTMLSGGEKHRLAIAALLAQTPSVYLLDEPVNHLDLYYQKHLLEHFIWLAKTQHVSVCMTLHDVNIAERYCDWLLLLFPDGRTIQGTPTQVLTRENLLRLYGCNMRKTNFEDTFWVLE